MRMEHGLQSRVRQQQHRPGDICINRTLIKKRLLVEFSCEFPTLYLPLRFTALYYHLSLDKWSLQQQNLTTLWNSALCGLLIFLLLILSSSTTSCVLKVKKKLSRTLGVKGDTNQEGKSQSFWCTTVHWCIKTQYLVQTWQIVSFVQKACAVGFLCDPSMQSSGVVH